MAHHQLAELKLSLNDSSNDGEIEVKGRLRRRVMMMMMMMRVLPPSRIECLFVLGVEMRWFRIVTVLPSLTTVPDIAEEELDGLFLFHSLHLM